MADMRWEFIIPALVAAGLLGAMIMGMFRRRRGQYHPVGLRVTANPIFPPPQTGGRSDAQVVLKYNDVTFLATQLFLVELLMVNMGPTDFHEFKFGLTMPGGHNIIASNCRPPDMEHAVEAKPAVTPENWAKEMSFALRPFNRRDSYALKLYIHVSGKGGGIGEITPTTGEPVTFVDIPAIGKQLEEMVRLLGPIPFD